MDKLTKYGDYSHQSTLLGDVIRKSGADRFLAMVGIRPSTVTIYNVPTTDANWTAVATGLTGVLGWRLSERGGADFHFAFTAAPAAYATAFGWMGADTEITDIYVKRPGSTDINAQLIIWSV